MSAKARGSRLLDVLANLYRERSRDWLYARVLHGDVFVSGHREKDPNALVQPNSEVQLVEHSQYVSRGGDKLESVLPAAEEAGFIYKDIVVLDAGSSTGGFTHCLLRHGAKGVHAVDVGYNQLDYRLRSDSRVYVHERTNILSLEKNELEPFPQSAVADLSFRSMEGAAKAVLNLLRCDRPLLLALIKPQFELEHSGLNYEDFNGVVQDSGLQESVLKNTVQRLRNEGVACRATWPSGVKGSTGNQEYFALLELLS